jgi:ribonuclease P protein subunit RPR2
MSKKKERKSAEKQIRVLFAKAKKSSSSPPASKEFVRKARREAMHFNIKLPKETRQKFCKKCLAYFNPNNCSVRIRKGFVTIKCLNCKCVSRYKISRKN